MTTSWTPLACRSTQCRCHSMGCAQPINGRSSMGLGRVDLLVLAGVSPTTTLTAVQACEHAPAGTRRGICDGSWPHGVQAEVLGPCQHRASVTNNRVRPFRSPVARSRIGSAESLPVCNRVVNVAGRPERLRWDVCVIDSRVGGILAKHRHLPERRAAAIAVAYVAGLLIAASVSTPRRVGDGGEYFVMTMRLAAGQAPSVAPEELDAARGALQRLGSGFESALIEYPTLVARDGRQEFLHYFLYSLIVAPMMPVTRALGLHPNWAFTLTNTWLLGAAVFVAIRRAPLAACLTAFLSPIVWWVDKAHSEAFLFAALAIAVVWWDRHPAAALLAYALAGAQNVALGMTYPIFAVLVWAATRQKMFGRAATTAAGAGALLVISPLLYNRVRLGRWSPMAEYATTAVPSFSGLAAFVLEPNIGILPNAPAFAFVLLAGTQLLWQSARRALPANLTLLCWWPVVIQIILLIIWSQNPNANHGGTPGMNRWVLSLIVLGMPILAAAASTAGQRTRMSVTALIAACGAWSVASHLPARPENYLQPTRLASWIWDRGWLQVTPAEVFAERSQHREPASIPSHFGACRVLLIASQQIPVNCVPLAQELPAYCQRPGALCYAIADGDRTRVIAAANNGFFHFPAEPSWPASGPLASGLRQVLTRIDPIAHVWRSADPRPWRERLRGAEVGVVLRSGDATFVYIARTHDVVPFPTTAGIRIYSLIPVASLPALPLHATNLGLVVK
jgi:hypothetical protein